MVYKFKRKGIDVGFNAGFENELLEILLCDVGLLQVRLFKVKF